MINKLKDTNNKTFEYNEIEKKMEKVKMETDSCLNEMVKEIHELLLNKEQSKQLYSPHKDKDFYKDLCDYMSSGECLCCSCHKDCEDPIEDMKKLKDKVREKTPPYAIFQAQEADTTITMYESGKI